MFIFDTYFDQDIQAPKKLFIFIHGYNANAQDILALSRYFFEDIDNCLFLAPNAPNINYIMENSFYWYHVESFEPEYLDFQLSQIMPKFCHYIDELKEKYSVKNEDIYLCGFSQGALLCLHYGLTQKKPFAGLISHSGGLIPEILTKYKLNKSPTCIVHGKFDAIIPYEYSQKCESFLIDKNIPNQLHLIDELNHSFNPHSIAAIKKFINF